MPSFMQVFIRLSRTSRARRPFSLIARQRAYAWKRRHEYRFPTHWCGVGCRGSREPATAPTSAMRSSQQLVQRLIAGHESEDPVETPHEATRQLRRRCVLPDLQNAIEPPDEIAGRLDCSFLPTRCGHQLVHQALGKPNIGHGCRRGTGRHRGKRRPYCRAGHGPGSSPIRHLR